MKDKCRQYVEEHVINREVHDKFLAPDGLVRLLIAREYKVA